MKKSAQQKIKDILEKCNEFYSNGDLYTLTKEDVDILDTNLKLSLDTEQVSDEIYDLIYYTAAAKYSNDLFFKQLTSTDTGYGKEIIHDIPMGSMDELKTGDWDKWKGNHKAFVLSDKLDGCSVIVKYRDGKLFSIATRGRGYKGKDLSRHLVNLTNIPQVISYTDELIVRGELLFPKDHIDQIIQKINEKTGKVQKNGRNTIAGLLNSKESSDYLKDAHFVTYWTQVSLGDSFKLLSSLGFEVAFNHIVYTKSEDACTLGTYTLSEKDLINMVKTRLTTSEYELDGIILTQLDNIEEGFETGTINPKASRKFKIGIYNNIAESVVTNIKWQISKFGNFTPVLEIEPREVCGCTVTNITGHNYKNLIDKKCGIGSKIKFCRSGLVIPHLLQVLTESENYNLPDVKTKIDGVNLKLDDWSFNEYSCEACIQDMVYFGRKLDIDQMGYGNCKKLLSNFMKDNVVLNSLAFLQLPEGKITEIIGKNGEKLEACLKAKKTASTEVQLAAALGVFDENIGERILEPVFNKYSTLFVTKEQLDTIENFGEIRKEQYLNRLSHWKNAREILLNCGWQFKTKSTGTKLKDFVVCFSGIRDAELSKYIEDNGGIATDSWKNSVTHLVVKDKNTASNKIKKALQNNVPILFINEIKDIIKTIDN